MVARNHDNTVEFPARPGDTDQTLGAIKAKFLARYPRVSRPSELVEMDDDEAKFYPVLSGFRVGKLKEPPLDGYGEVARFRLNDINPVNELLCYRILKRTYGAPDIAVASANPQEDMAHVWDWGYCVRIHDAALVEVRRISHSIFLVFWGVEESVSETRQRATASFERFIEDLKNALRRGKALFHGKGERKRASGAGVANPYAEKYAAAVELMRLAAKSDRPRDWKRWKWNVPIDFPITGSVYLAAILFFYTALEAFEQLVRSHLAQPKFRIEPGLEEMRRTPLKERIARLHDFCDGFRESPAPIGGDLYKRLRILSRVRNEVIHGNTPGDMNIFGFSEDGFVFIYSPEQDDEDKAWTKHSVPFSRGQTRRRHAEYVKKLVDEVVSATIDSLTEEHKGVVRGYRDQALLIRDSDGRVGLPPEMVR